MTGYWTCDIPLMSLTLYHWAILADKYFDNIYFNDCWFKIAIIFAKKMLCALEWIHSLLKWLVYCFSSVTLHLLHHYLILTLSYMGSVVGLLLLVLVVFFLQRRKTTFCQSGTRSPSHHRSSRSHSRSSPREPPSYDASLRVPIQPHDGEHLEERDRMALLPVSATLPSYEEATRRALNAGTVLI